MQREFFKDCNSCCLTSVRGKSEEKELSQFKRASRSVAMAKILSHISGGTCGGICGGSGAEMGVIADSIGYENTGGHLQAVSTGP